MLAIMKFLEVLKHTNADGKIYACDIKRWLNVWTIPYKEFFEIQDKLTEMRNFLTNKNNENFIN